MSTAEDEKIAHLESLRLARLPITIETEATLLCACWEDPENTRILLGSMTPKNFHTGTGKLQFQVLQESWKRYQDVSPMTIRRISDEMGSAYLSAFGVVLAQYTSDAGRGVGQGQMKALMQQASEASARFHYLRALERAHTDLLEDSRLTLAEVQAQVSATLSAAAGYQRHTAEHWDTGLSRLEEEIRANLQAEAEGKDALTRVMTTGIDTIDQILGGIEESDYVVVAARTGVGKTAFSLGVATHLAQNYGSVLFCSLELSLSKMWRRVAVQQSSYPLSVVSRRPDLVARARQVNANLWIDDSRIRPSQLQQRIELFRLEHPDLCCVFVDHLGILAEPPRLFEQTSAASNAVRDAMKATGIPIVALVQINRAATNRDGGRPTMSDLRMSGDIEQDARKIILLHRDPRKPDAVGDPWKATAIIEKNGEGETGDALLLYNGPLFTFMPGYVAPGKGGGSDAHPFPTHNAPEFEDLDVDGIY